MSTEKLVAAHYTEGSLLGRIEIGLKALGKSVDDVSLEDLGPVEEFHTGGRVATKALLDQLSLSENHHILDVGCGLGGSSRFAANQYGCRVTGIDLTKEFIETGQTINQWVGLESKIDLGLGSATDLGFDEAQFDHAFMLHVGMNIDDKRAIMKNVFRVLKPGGCFAVYDMMRVGDAALELPVPWASAPAANAIAAPEDYRDAFTAAGFSIIAERDRKDFALDFFTKVKAQNALQDGPPPIGIHVVMGDNAAVKVKHVFSCMTNGGITPVEMIGQTPS